MKKISKIFVSCLIVFSMFIQPTSAFASETVISFAEYSRQIKEKYAEYGMNIEMTPISNDFVYTQELLDKELNKLALYGPQFVNKKINKSQILDNQNRNGTISPNAMYATVTCSAQSRLYQPDIFIAATCEIRTTANLQVDIQGDRIVKAYTPTLDVRSAIGYADYIKLISYTTKFNNNATNRKDRCVVYNMVVELKVEVSISGVSAWSKEEKNHFEFLYPFK